jgi:hypothetical protein
MPITSLWCPAEGREVPLDHYEGGHCIKLPMPLPWILGIQANTLGDTRHPAGKLSASSLSGCPRERAINGYLPVSRVDLRKFNSMAHGWAAHLFCQTFTPKSMLAEVAFKGVLFKGTEFEVEVIGHADALQIGDVTAVVLEDYKITSETNQRYMTETTEKAEYNVQFSVYRLLAAQSTPTRDIKRMAFWSGAAVPRKSKAAPWVYVPARILTEEEILTTRPYDGESSVADHIMDFKRLQADLAAGGAVREAVARMPLRGEMQWRRKDGTSKCDYCVVADACAALVQGAGEEGRI